MNLTPPALEVPDSSEEDPRIGQILHIQPSPENDIRVAIIGFPSDEGVRRNNGRPGASSAPDEIRRQLYNMTPPAENHEQFTALVDATVDAGNVAVSMDLESAQEDLGKVAANYLGEGVIPIILGGGHETAFGHFLGYVEAGLTTSILNLDAHADVRPLKDGKAHSGSPFRQALEHEGGYCEQYLVAGLQPHSTAKDHLDYIEKKGGSYHFRDETNVTSISGMFHEHSSDRLMVTFDMDAVDQSFAPGVSAPCANGLHPDLWLMGAYLAGRNEEVTSVDVSETNPSFDRDEQTVRLAALTIWHFLLGLSER